jgi:iron complex outermembrane receptor protein
VGALGAVRAAATLADVRHREEIDDAPVQRYRQRLWSVGAEGDGAAGAVRWSGGLAVDGASTPESGDKPPLGALAAWAGRAGATAALSPWASLHASLSSRARFPALRELYSGSLGRFDPNPELRPERLHAAEAGVTLRRGGAELQAVAFHHRLRDAIVRVAAGDGKLRRVNRDEVRGTGLELLAGWRRGLFALSADAALQRVRVHDPVSGEESRFAEHQPGIRASVNLEAPPIAGFRALGRAAYTGRQHCVHPEEERTVAVRGAARADVGVERTWGRRRGLLGRLRLAGWVDNVGDTAVYDQCGMPQAGRTLRLSVEVG